MISALLYQLGNMWKCIVQIWVYK